jgi:hypothetical protein
MIMKLVCVQYCTVHVKAHGVVSLVHHQGEMPPSPWPNLHAGALRAVVLCSNAGTWRKLSPRKSCARSWEGRWTCRVSRGVWDWVRDRLCQAIRHDIALNEAENSCFVNGKVMPFQTEAHCNPWGLRRFWNPSVEIQGSYHDLPFLVAGKRLQLQPIWEDCLRQLKLGSSCAPGVGTLGIVHVDACQRKREVTH